MILDTNDKGGRAPDPQARLRVGHMSRNLRNSMRDITGVVRTYNTLCLKIQSRDLVSPRVSEGSPKSPAEDSYNSTCKEREIPDGSS